jgi:glycosyltransferase involved in cell wall biosynthesis
MVESLKRFFIDHCDGFVVPGKSALDYLTQMGVSTQKIFLARNAVDIQAFARLGETARLPASRERTHLCLPERYFLFVGRLVREKGVMDLLNAYRTMPAEMRERIGLVFAGDGAMRAELEATSRDIYPGTVHFTGFVDRDGLASYYGLAECLVLPTYSDTWGLVVNEAMACGLPVICTNVAGCAAELVQGNGRLVEAGNVEQLAQAMVELAGDPERREEMSAQSCALIREFSPDAWAAGMAEAAEAVERL